MAVKVHYEILAQENRTTGWALFEAKANRDGALKLAKNLMDAGGLTGIRVVKQAYDEISGEYRAITIYEDGLRQTLLSAEEEDVTETAPCSQPEDFYSGPARKAIFRYLYTFLVHNKLTATELLHRSDMLDKLENTGTFLQHAVQSAAMARSGSGQNSVQHQIRHLHDLVVKAYARVFYDSKHNVFPHIPGDGFGKLASKLATNADGIYILNGALSNYLSDSRDWNDKIVRLLRLTEIPTPNEAGHRLLMAAVGGMAAEIVHSAAAVQELIGPKDNFGEALYSLTSLLVGRVPPTHDPALPGLIGLCRQFAKDKLPKARLTLAARLVAELRRYKRLGSGSLLEELTVMEEIAALAANIPGKYMVRDALAGALDLRSHRLVADDNLSPLLQRRSAEDKIELLLSICDRIYGKHNKMKLLSAVRRLAEGEDFRESFLSGGVPIIKRLQSLAGFIAAVQSNNVPERSRMEAVQALDKIALEAAVQAKLFERIATQPVNAAEKTVMISKLFTGGAIAEGMLANKAREQMLNYVSRPGFLKAYVEQLKAGGVTVDAASATMELVDMLKKAGIAPEQSLKAMVA